MLKSSKAEISLLLPKGFISSRRSRHPQRLGWGFLNAVTLSPADGLHHVMHALYL